MGKLMGITEIAELMDKKYNNVVQMHRRGQLPPHDDTVGGGRTKIWNRDTIEKWLQEEQT